MKIRLFHRAKMPTAAWAFGRIKPDTPIMWRYNGERPRIYAAWLRLGRHYFSVSVTDAAFA